MADAKVITVTGIPGAGSTNFCKTYNDGKMKVKTYNIGDMISEFAQNYPEKPPIPEENILNFPPELLDSYRDRAFERIFGNLEKDKSNYERIIIDTHAQFFKNKRFYNTCKWKYLNELETDLFLTIIDKPSDIKDRQMGAPQGKSQDHSLENLLLWQNLEVNITEGWASNYGKPMYTLPSMQDPQIIDSLLNNYFLVYLQMPMTGVSKETDKIITRFKKRLLKEGKKINGVPTPLIDPRDVDLETESDFPEELYTTNRSQTVHRDLNWYIKKATDVIAFYPKGTNISKGVSDESTRGFETGKDAYVIYPRERTSPFMDISTILFLNEKEFFDFFPKYMKERLEFYKRDNWM